MAKQLLILIFVLTLPFSAYSQGNRIDWDRITKINPDKPVYAEAAYDSCPEVVLSSDKQEYKLGDKVKLFLKNNSPMNIYPMGRLYETGDWELYYGLEKFENGTWQHVRGSKSLANVPSKNKKITLKEIKPGETQVSISEFLFRSPGRHRIHYSARVLCEQAIKKIGLELDGFKGSPLCRVNLYLKSNEFEVQSLKVAFSTDKLHYAQGEPIKITLNNTGSINLFFSGGLGSIEFYKDGKWINLWESSGYRLSFMRMPQFGGVLAGVMPGQSYSWIWEQKMQKEGAKDEEFIYTPKGRYRVAVMLKAPLSRGYGFSERKYTQEFNID